MQNRSAPKPRPSASCSDGRVLRTDRDRGVDPPVARRRRVRDPDGVRRLVDLLPRRTPAADAGGADEAGRRGRAAHPRDRERDRRRGARFATRSSAARRAFARRSWSWCRRSTRRSATGRRRGQRSGRRAGAAGRVAPAPERGRRQRTRRGRRLRIRCRQSRTPCGPSAPTRSSSRRIPTGVRTGSRRGSSRRARALRRADHAHRRRPRGRARRDSLIFFGKARARRESLARPLRGRCRLIQFRAVTSCGCRRPTSRAP